MLKIKRVDMSEYINVNNACQLLVHPVCTIILIHFDDLATHLILDP